MFSNQHFYIAAHLFTLEKENEKLEARNEMPRKSVPTGKKEKRNKKKKFTSSQFIASSWNVKTLLQSIYGTFRKKCFMWRFPHLHFQFAVIVIELVMFVNIARHIFFFLKGYFLCVKCSFIQLFGANEALCRFTYALATLLLKNSDRLGFYFTFRRNG